MSDEQTMPEVIYAGILDASEMSSPFNSSDKPYLRCPDNIDPADAVVVSRKQRDKSDANAHADAVRYNEKYNELAEAIATIATLAAERDALRGDVQAAIDTIKQNQANPTDKYVEQRTMYLLDRLTTALAAQLKEQDDA